MTSLNKPESRYQIYSDSHVLAKRQLCQQHDPYSWIPREALEVFFRTTHLGPEHLVFTRSECLATLGQFDRLRGIQKPTHLLRTEGEIFWDEDRLEVEDFLSSFPEMDLVEHHLRQTINSNFLNGSGDTVACSDEKVRLSNPLEFDDLEGYTIESFEDQDGLTYDGE